jgi:hypothetical protein
MILYIDQDRISILDLFLLLQPILIVTFMPMPAPLHILDIDISFRALRVFFPFSFVITFLIFFFVIILIIVYFVIMIITIITYLLKVNTVKQ